MTKPEQNHLGKASQSCLSLPGKTPTTDPTEPIAYRSLT